MKTYKKRVYVVTKQNIKWNKNFTEVYRPEAEAIKQAFEFQDEAFDWIRNEIGKGQIDGLKILTANWNDDHTRIDIAFEGNFGLVYKIIECEMIVKFDEELKSKS